MKFPATVRIFGNPDSTFSLDRYARELAQAFPVEFDTKALNFRCSGGVIQKQIDRFVGYAKFVRQHQGDFNILVSEAMGHLLRVLPGEQTICVCHDLYPLLCRAPLSLKMRYYSSRYRWALSFLSRAKYVVTVSEATKNDLLNQCPFIPEEKVIAIHNGLSAKWKPVPPERLQVLRSQLRLDRKRVILHVGDDVPRKNLSGLVQAFAHLESEDVVLIQVGSVRGETLELLNKFQFRSRFRQLTNPSDYELAQLYSLAEVMVFPSWMEGFGWPPLEAMACECPVIVSNRSSLPEICGDASLYVDPTDVQQIGTAIHRVLHSAALRKHLVELGRRQVSKFSWQKTAAQFVQLMQS